MNNQHNEKSDHFTGKAVKPKLPTILLIDLLNLYDEPGAIPEPLWREMMQRKSEISNYFSDSSDVNLDISAEFSENNCFLRFTGNGGTFEPIVFTLANTENHWIAENYELVSANLFNKWVTKNIHDTEFSKAFDKQFNRSCQADGEVKRTTIQNLLDISRNGWKAFLENTKKTAKTA